jgi:hypothetical protein
MFWTGIGIGMALGIYLGFQAYKQYLKFKWDTDSINLKRKRNEDNHLFVVHRALPKRNGTSTRKENNSR